MAGAPLAADLPSVSIGLRSTAIKSDGVTSNLVDRAFGNGGGEAVVRKVGIAWKPAQSRVFLNQGLGIRFDGDDRLTVRLKKGSFGLYMQSSFLARREARERGTPHAARWQRPDRCDGH